MRRGLVGLAGALWILQCFIVGAVGAQAPDYQVLVELNEELLEFRQPAEVNGFPDYYLIDAEGKLRLADCANGNVEKAIEILLEELEE